MSKIYTPQDWYWIKADGETLYSSKLQSLVKSDDSDYQAWAVDGTHPTLWPKDEEGEQSDEALQEVLAPYGLTIPGAASSVDKLVAYAAAKRYQVETGGITVGGTRIATDRESQFMIRSASAYVKDASAASVSYKSLSGFVTMTADQIKDVALAVGSHVQACFAAEAEAVAKITAKKPAITDEAGVDAAFDSVTA